MRRRALASAALALWAAAAWGADSSSLAARQADAKRQQGELRARIEALQKDIDSQESSRDDAATALRESESAISDIDRRLGELADQKRHAEQALRELSARIAQQKKLLAQREEQLGDQLRAQYASGLSPWTALLSGDDPQAIGRDLGYLRYISESQAKAVRGVREAIAELRRLQGESEAQGKRLAEVAQETSQRKKELEEQKGERRKVLERIDTALAAQRGQAQRLQGNDKRLADLIGGLDDAIAKQREAERIAEEKRRAEAQRRAELERQKAREREEAARRAEQAAREAQERAKRERDQLAAERARLQVEEARARQRAAEAEAQAARERAQADAESACPVTLRGSLPGLASEPAPASPPAAAPAERAPEPPSRPARPAQPAPAERPAAAPRHFAGLSKGRPYPVRGEIQGRFGAERPDGGLWRGIVLRTAEGTPVQAIAPGRVVYANWLSGFGNLIIVDHGAKYLSVYAYNQSLLKRVGDTVDAGDTIASVGATGGQVEPGLYFEIRHEGTPVNPLLWLRR